MERLGLDETFADGKPGKLDPVVNVELLHQVGAVLLYGLDAQASGMGDLLLRQSFGQVAEDLQLPRGQKLRARAHTRRQARPVGGDLQAAAHLGTEAGAPLRILRMQVSRPSGAPPLVA